MGKALAIQAGDVFNDLTAVRSISSDKKQGHVWEFDCGCGSKRIVKSAAVIQGRVKSCGCHWKRPSSPTRHYHCSICKTHKPYSNFYIRKNGAPHGYCKDCSPGHHVKYKSSDDGRITCMFNSLKAGARKRQIPFEISKSDLWQLVEERGWICAKTGVPLNLAIGNGTQPFNPTIDRIDSNAGYTSENIQLVCYMYNVAKNQFGDDDVLTFARALIERQEMISATGKPNLRIIQGGK